jgi:hypothetical protein
MPTRAAHEAIQDIINPIRHNDLLKRRRELGLSRVALGRILGVDPGTVYRQEQKRPMAALWDYALRGIEAEAKASRGIRRSFKAKLDGEAFIPDQLDERGYSYTAEKMHEARREHAQRPRSLKAAKPKPSAEHKPSRRPGNLPAREARLA